MSMTPIAKPSPRPNGWQFPRRGAFLLLLLTMTVAGALTVLISVSPYGDKVDEDVWITVGSQDDFDIGAPVRPDAFPRAWIVHLESGELIALSSRSTHLGCSVPWRADFEFSGVTGWFRDPCSGTTWDITGNKAFGPAPRDMDQYVIDAGGGKVRIDTTRVLCGDDGRQVRRLDGAPWPCSLFRIP